MPGMGGVYVPATKETPPNPYLEVPQRDIAIHSGTVLTLMNPAYMTRQVHELAAKAYGIYSHITSLNPIRPANASDPWETQALQAFHRGIKEVSGVEEMKGEAYMRQTETKSERDIIYEKLTNREREVFQLIIEGHKNREIANLLHVSIKTVETHKAHIMDKLNVHSTAELIRYAMDKDLFIKDF
jgi:DNA-binding CsgD family transcriptional regulator